MPAIGRARSFSARTFSGMHSLRTAAFSVPPFLVRATVSASRTLTRTARCARSVHRADCAGDRARTQLFEALSLASVTNLLATSTSLFFFVLSFGSQCNLQKQTIEHRLHVPKIVSVSFGQLWSASVNFGQLRSALNMSMIIHRVYGRHGRCVRKYWDVVEDSNDHDDVDLCTPGFSESSSEEEDEEIHNLILNTLPDHIYCCQLKTVLTKGCCIDIKYDNDGIFYPAVIVLIRHFDVWVVYPETNDEETFTRSKFVELTVRHGRCSRDCFVVTAAGDIVTQGMAVEAMYKDGKFYSVVIQEITREHVSLYYVAGDAYEKMTRSQFVTISVKVEADAEDVSEYPRSVVKRSRLQEIVSDDDDECVSAAVAAAAAAADDDDDDEDNDDHELEYMSDDDEDNDDDHELEYMSDDAEDNDDDDDDACEYMSDDHMVDDNDAQVSDGKQQTKRKRNSSPKTNRSLHSDIKQQIRKHIPHFRECKNSAEFVKLVHDTPEIDASAMPDAVLKLFFRNNSAKRAACRESMALGKDIKQQIRKHIPHFRECKNSAEFVQLVHDTPEIDASAVHNTALIMFFHNNPIHLDPDVIRQILDQIPNLKECKEKCKNSVAFVRLVRDTLQIGSATDAQLIHFFHDKTDQQQIADRVSKFQTKLLPALNAVEQTLVPDSDSRHQRLNVVTQSSESVHSPDNSVTLPVKLQGGSALGVSYQITLDLCSAGANTSSLKWVDMSSKSALKNSELQYAVDSAMLLYNYTPTIVVMATGQTQLTITNPDEATVYLMNTKTTQCVELTVQQCSNVLASVCASEKEQRAFLWASLRGTAHQEAEISAYAHCLQLFEGPHSDHCRSVGECTVAARAGIAQASTQSLKPLMLLPLWGFLTQLTAIVNHIDLQRRVPALCNYSRVDLQQGCGVRNELYSNLAPLLVDHVLPYGRKAQSISASMRQHSPQLAREEQIDLAEKNLQFAKMCCAEALANDTDYVKLMWTVQYKLAEQCAYNLTH